MKILKHILLLNFFLNTYLYADFTKEKLYNNKNKSHWLLKDYSDNNFKYNLLYSSNHKNISFIEEETDGNQMTIYNNFLFLVPPLLWNLAFTSRLPMDHFSGKASNWILIPENIARFATMAYPLFLPIDTNHELFKPGLAVYTIGLAAYFGSWIYLMNNSDSELSNKPFMQFAPAYTPIVWLSGMSMMAESKSLFILSTIFITLHVLEYVQTYKR